MIHQARVSPFAIVGVPGTALHQHLFFGLGGCLESGAASAHFILDHIVLVRL